MIDEAKVKKIEAEVTQEVEREYKTEQDRKEGEAIAKSSFIKLCLDSGINLATALQYRAQLLRFLRDYRIDSNGSISGKVNDEALLERMVRYTMENKRCYNRRYAMKKALELWGKEVLMVSFNKKTKGIKMLPRRLLQKSLSLEEYRKITNELPEPYSLVLKMMFETAFRIHPVLYLDRKQVSVEGGRIKLIVTEKGDRIITAYLSKDTSKKLANWINTNGIKTGRLFDIGYHHFEENLKRYGQEILSKDISTHFGKVSRAMYEFEEKGTDVRRVQQILHHKNIDTTLIYLQESGLDSKKEMEKLEKDALWG